MAASPGLVIPGYPKLDRTALARTCPLSVRSQGRIRRPTVTTTAERDQLLPVAPEVA
jgi:hypothetical protein